MKDNIIKDLRNLLIFCILTFVFFQLPIIEEINKSTLALTSVIIIFILIYLLTIKFQVVKNIVLSKNILLIIMSIIIISSLLKIEDNSQIIKEEYFNIVAVLILSISFLYICSLIEIKGDSIKEENLPELLPERKRDLKRLKDYINQYDIVGLNGPWGSGKSLLIEYLKQEEKEYYYIDINIVAINIDEIISVLINELENLLKNKGIISRHSKTIKKYLEGDAKLRIISSKIFEDNEFYSEALRGLKNELSKLDKKIIIICEDLDRINNIEILKQIFNINEKLSCEYIKVIYQYDRNNLEILGFDENYLEKYIPYDVNLTSLDLKEALNFKIKEKIKYKDLFGERDLLFLFSNIELKGSLESVFKVIINYKVNHYQFSIRRIEEFLEEIVLYKKLLKNETDKKVIISFFFLKRFVPDTFKKINTLYTLEEIFTIEIENENSKEEYTLTELIRAYNNKNITSEDIIRSFSNEIKVERTKKAEGSLWNLFVLNLFGIFDIRREIKNPSDNEDVNLRIKNVMEEEPYNLEQRNKLDKIQRLVWYLVSMGNSEFTDFEYVGKKFIKEVLEFEKEEWEEKYKAFRKELFYGNRSIFLIGVPSFVQLFKSFRILEVDSGNYRKLLDFYIMKEGKNLSTEFFQTINFYEIKNKKDLLYLLEKINEFEFIYNFEKEDSFKEFFIGIINNLAEFGFISDGWYYNIRFFIEDGYKKNLISLIEELEDNRIKLSRLIKSEEFNNEMETVKTFLYKISTMLDKDFYVYSIIENTPMEIRKTDLTKDIKKNLINLYEEEFQEFNKKLNEEYIAERINLRDVEYILNKIKDKD